MLLRLRIKGFKNLRDVDIRFGPLTNFRSFQPVGNATLQNMLFVLVIQTDNECSGGVCVNEYFNTQAILKLNDTGGADLLWSNMQAEYR